MSSVYINVASRHPNTSGCTCTAAARYGLLEQQKLVLSAHLPVRQNKLENMAIKMH